jgi:hypothetical protein
MEDGIVYKKAATAFHALRHQHVRNFGYYHGTEENKGQTNFYKCGREYMTLLQTAGCSKTNEKKWGEGAHYPRAMWLPRMHMGSRGYPADHASVPVPGNLTLAPEGVLNQR